MGAGARLDWLGEGLEELTIQRLSAAGQQVYSHGGRVDELDLYGLPASAKISRATMLHVAQEMDADFVVYGNLFQWENADRERARASRESPIATARGAGKRRAGITDRIAHAAGVAAGQIVRFRYPLSLPEFTYLQRPLQLAAFEQYIRGLLAMSMRCGCAI